MDTTDSFTKKYVRKPLYVDAVQITENNFGEVARWCTGEIRRLSDDVVVDRNDPDLEPSRLYIRVRVNNPKSPSQTKGKLQDWILYTDHGGYKVYTPKAFEANFDLVTQDTLVGDPDSEEVAV